MTWPDCGQQHGICRCNDAPLTCACIVSHALSSLLTVYTSLSPMLPLREEWNGTIDHRKRERGTGFILESKDKNYHLLALL